MRKFLICFGIVFLMAFCFVCGSIYAMQKVGVYSESPATLVLWGNEWNHN